MPKKAAKKKSAEGMSGSKTAHHSEEHTHPHDLRVEKVLVENFVALQKVMTHLSVKFDNLTKQISELLGLFEISAKTMAQKDFDFNKPSEKEEEMVKKLDTLLEQNKVIARGLTLLHEPGSKPAVPQMQSSSSMPLAQMQKPIPGQSPRQMVQDMAKEVDEYSGDMRNYQRSVDLSLPRKEFMQKLPSERKTEFDQKEF